MQRQTKELTDSNFNYGKKDYDGQFEHHPTLPVYERRRSQWTRPRRNYYRHEPCNKLTRIANPEIVATWATDPKFYTETFCAHCGGYFSVSEFIWLDGKRLGS